MNDLLISPRTETAIDAFLVKPGQAILITGRPGAGKFAVALYLSSQLLNLDNPEKLGVYPYFYQLAPADGKKEISIAQVREVVLRLGLKTLGSGSVRRVVLVENADRLSTEAQNALLKSLEEVPRDTVFILTAPSRASLLPTIASRVNELPVQPIGLPHALKYLAGSYEPAKVESAWRLSGGQTGLMLALLAEDTSHPLKQAVDSFKAALAANKEQRLLIMDNLEKDKQGLANFLDAGSRILAVLHDDATKKGNLQLAKQLLRSRKELLRAQELLQANSMPRLIILNLALNLTV